MYPLLYGLANLSGSTLLKAGNHGFTIGAYLPIPKFVGVTPDVQSMLQSRTFHWAVNVATRSLQSGARLSIPMTFGDSTVRLCRTPLVGWIADTPEEAMIACAGEKQSPITTASEFGDAEQHDLRDRAYTLAVI